MTGVGHDSLATDGLFTLRNRPILMILSRGIKTPTLPPILVYKYITGSGRFTEMINWGKDPYSNMGLTIDLHNHVLILFLSNFVKQRFARPEVMLA